MQGAMDLDLQAQMAQLGDSLRNARPDLPWGGAASGCAASRAWAWATPRRRSRSSPTSTTSRRRSARTTPAPRSTTSTRRRCSARSAAAAVDDVAALRRIERELLEQGYLVRDGQGRLELSPRAVRRVGATALRKVFAELEAGGRGGHDVQDAGAAGETTGASRAWQFGDEQPLDVVRTVRNAVLRAGRVGHRRAPARRGLRGRRDRAPHLRRRRAARRPVVLDGAARHLGHGQVDRARAALAGDDEVPAGRDRDHRLQRLRAGAHAREARRARRASACRAPTCSTRSCSPAATSASTPTASRSSWSSPTASRRPT